MNKIQEWFRRAKEYPQLKKDYEIVRKSCANAHAEKQAMAHTLATTERHADMYQALCRKFIPSDVTAEDIYFAVAPTYDEEGFALFRAAEQILGQFDYGHFYYEDSRGYFEEMDGYGMLRYLEADHAVALGDNTKNRWEVVPGTTCEKWINLTVNHDTEEYQAYLNKLYQTVLTNMGIADAVK